MAKSAPTGRPGRASAAVPRPKARQLVVMVARGGSRSAADSNVVAPISWAREGPNMPRAESRAEPVSRKISVPSASPLTVCAATCTALVRKSGLNSGARSRSRYVRMPESWPDWPGLINVSQGGETMGWWQVNADTLAGSRFVLSPLAETTACLIVLAKGVPGHLGERSWLDTHLASYRERLAGDPIAALLVPSALGRRWIADFLTPPPTADGEEAFENEGARIRETPAEVALADLTVSLGSPLPALLDRPDLPQRTADLLEWVWAECVLPYWPRRGRILQADVIARMAPLSQAGGAAALNDMRPGMRWLR